MLYIRRQISQLLDTFLVVLVRLLIRSLDERLKGLIPSSRLPETASFTAHSGARSESTQDRDYAPLLYRTDQERVRYRQNISFYPVQSPYVCSSPQLATSQTMHAQTWTIRSAKVRRVVNAGSAMIASTCINQCGKCDKNNFLPRVPPSGTTKLCITVTTESRG